MSHGGTQIVAKGYMEHSVRCALRIPWSVMELSADQLGQLAWPFLLREQWQRGGGNVSGSYFAKGNTLPIAGAAFTGGASEQQVEELVCGALRAWDTALSYTSSPVESLCAMRRTVFKQLLEQHRMHATADGDPVRVLTFRGTRLVTRPGKKLGVANFFGVVGDLQELQEYATSVLQQAYEDMDYSKVLGDLTLHAIGSSVVAQDVLVDLALHCAAFAQRSAVCAAVFASILSRVMQCASQTCDSPSSPEKTADPFLVRVVIPLLYMSEHVPLTVEQRLTISRSLMLVTPPAVSRDQSSDEASDHSKAAFVVVHYLRGSSRLCDEEPITKGPVIPSATAAEIGEEEERMNKAMGVATVTQTVNGLRDGDGTSHTEEIGDGEHEMEERHLILSEVEGSSLSADPDMDPVCFRWAANECGAEEKENEDAGSLKAAPVSWSEGGSDSNGKAYAASAVAPTLSAEAVRLGAGSATTLSDVRPTRGGRERLTALLKSLPCIKEDIVAEDGVSCDLVWELSCPLPWSRSVTVVITSLSGAGVVRFVSVPCTVTGRGALRAVGDDCGVDDSEAAAHRYTLRAPNGYFSLQGPHIISVRGTLAAAPIEQGSSGGSSAPADDDPLQMKAELHVDMEVPVDMRWEEELRVVLSAACERMVRSLFCFAKRTPSLLTERAMLLFRHGSRYGALGECGSVGGGVECQQSSCSSLKCVAGPTEWVQSVLTMPDEEIRKQVCCLTGDVPAVRGALLLTAYASRADAGVPLSLSRPEWKDVLRRIRLASRQLSECKSALAVALAVVRHVRPSLLPPSKAAEAAVAFLVLNWRESQVQEFVAVQDRSSTACTVALSLLQKVLRWAAVPQLTAVAHCVVELLNMDDFATFVAAHNTGAHQSIRREMAAVIDGIFSRTCLTLSRCTRCRLQAVQPLLYVHDVAEHGLLLLAGASITASVKTIAEMELCQKGFVTQLMSLLANFTDFARTNALALDEPSEDIYLWAVTTLLGTQSALVFSEDPPQETVDAVPSLGMPASELDMAVLRAQQEVKELWEVPSATTYSKIKVPVYSPNQHLLRRWRCEFRLCEAAPSALVIGLATAVQGSSQSGPDATCGIVILYNSAGRLIVDQEAFFVPPLAGGDKVAFTAAFSVTHRAWIVTVELNKCFLGKYPVPHKELFAFVNQPCPPYGRRVVIIVEFFRETQLRESAAFSDRLFPALTPQHVASYTQAAFHVLVLRAVGQLEALRRSTTAGVSCCGVTPSPTKGAGHTAMGVGAEGSVLGPTDNTLLATDECSRESPAIARQIERLGCFIDGCANILCANILSVLLALNKVPMPAEDWPSCDRVKLRVATLVYTNALERYLATASRVIQVASPKTSLFSALCDVVCCSRLDNSLRTEAMRTLNAALRRKSAEVISFQAIPQQLWCCVKDLSKSTASAMMYWPTFSSSSVGPSLHVHGGGRSVGYQSSKISTASGATMDSSVALLSALLHGDSERALRLLEDRGVLAAPVQRRDIPASNQRHWRCAAFAVKGIPLDGSAGDVVSFSIRITRSFSTNFLGRYYFVGLSPNPASESQPLLRDYMDGRISKATYSLPDHFGDCSERLDRDVLLRNGAKWLSQADQIIFGSGDVITVTVDTKLHTIAFARNEHDLGVLYSGVTASSGVLYPFVCLYNANAAASFLFPPSPTVTAARQLLRTMLALWSSELIPQVSDHIENYDVASLQVLGSDGDELLLLLKPKAGEAKRHDTLVVVQKVRKQVAEVLVLEGSEESAEGVPKVQMSNSSDGELSRRRWTKPSSAASLTLLPSRGVATVCAAALEQDVLSHLQEPVDIEPFIVPLFRMISNAVSVIGSAEAADGTTAGSPGDVRRVKLCSPHAVLRALRLLADLDVDTVMVTSESLPLPLKQQFLDAIGLLTRASMTVSPIDAAKTIASNAWKTITDAAVGSGDSLLLSVPSASQPPKAALCGRGAVSNAVRPLFHGDFTALMCPQCACVWHECTMDHAAPESYAELLHYVLTRHHVSHIYTAWRGTWEPVDHSDTLTVKLSWDTARPRAVSGRGRDTRGEFTFSGEEETPMRVVGQVTYQFLGAPPCQGLAGLNEEWDCEVCTFHNEANSTRCAMCTTERPNATWACSFCSYRFNTVGTEQCATCGSLQAQPHGLSFLRENHSNHTAYCRSCGETVEYSDFEAFVEEQHCARCGDTRLFAPSTEHSAIATAKLVGMGDQLEWVVEFSRQAIVTCHLRNLAYSVEALEANLSNACPSEDLQMYVPPLSSLDSGRERMKGKMTSALSDGEASTKGCDEAVPQDPRIVTKPREPVIGDADASGELQDGIIYFASKVQCLWGPSLMGSSFCQRQVLQSLFVHDETWAKGITACCIDIVKEILRSTLDLLTEQPCDFVVLHSLTSLCSACIRTFPSQLQKYLSYVLYAISMITASRDTQPYREVAHAAINNALERELEVKWGFGSHPMKTDVSMRGVNAQSIASLVRRQPIVRGQLRSVVLAQLYGVNVATSNSVVMAMYWLARGIECMYMAEPLPACFDVDLSSAIPYVVAMPETRHNESGELLLGQIRGSIGVEPSGRGSYYFEIVLPESHRQRSNVTMVGWGTQQHEVYGSGQHVGCDIHSWAFNCVSRIRVLTSDQAVAPPREIVGGDVIGALLDLTTKMAAWSVNGHILMWVAIPTENDGGMIFPYVSASVKGPQGITVRLCNTQFKPSGYSDFTSSIMDCSLQTKSLVAPQSFSCYKELCGLVGELTGCGYSVQSLLETSAWTSRALCVITQYPQLLRVVQGDSPEVVLLPERLGALEPYVRHLLAVSHLTTIVVKSSADTQGSPLLQRIYSDAKELLFFSARWAITEDLIATRVNRSVVATAPTVFVDPVEARRCTASDVPVGVRLKSSVCGQLFHQLHARNVFCNTNMFTVQLADSIADDAGGVTRSVVSMMCEELMYGRASSGARWVEPLVPLFRLSDHSTMVTLIPNTALYKDLPEEHQRTVCDMYNWIGKMFGNAVLTGTIKYPLSLPCILWKFMVRSPAAIADYLLECDDTIRGSLEDDSFLLEDSYFLTIPGIAEYLRLQPAARQAAFPLMPVAALSRLRGLRSNANSQVDLSAARYVHGEQRPIRLTSVTDRDGPNETDSGEDRAALAAVRRRIAEQALLHQFDHLLQAMRDGMEAIVTRALLEKIRWDDLRLRVCGVSTASAEDVLACMDTSMLPPLIERIFVEAVKSFTNQQRSRLLLFCTGQSSLPVPERVRVLCGDEVRLMPTAHTCSPISLRLQPYATVEEMRRNLLVCLSHVYEFGFA